MKYQITRGTEVGEADHGWLHAKHYFSFANYYNPERMGFGKLRVINDDTIEPTRGFDTHPHRDMEIITIPLSGAVRHKDSKGHEGVIQKGEVQVMSAGRGILHSEFNHSDHETLKLFQIWIEPNEHRVEPRYDQGAFDFHSKSGEWTQLVSPMSSPNEAGLKIHQKAYINGTFLPSDQSISYQLKEASHGLFLLVAEGEIDIGDQSLTTRDAIALSEVNSINIRAKKDSSLLLLEVPLT